MIDLGATEESVAQLKPYTYEGGLHQAEAVSEKNIFLIGDALRTTDPLSGNGLNTAFRDADAWGEFARKFRKNEKGARLHLIGGLQANSRYTLNGSNFFRNCSSCPT